ncbi:bacterioferritin-associated ferredoxin [Alkalimonas sp.]|uniref:bacterioferritin-associated ferredoxin n=1 Tax=Alkalimonas sp. TaxID=1872453 RepID=UPI00263AF8D7|nr:bacterioferritin-associated ferredoxin [Alkalimonas sp.]MCC5824584.1 bacterioferritin-associated ferredoxin [Alkalimonas sp.]
MYVCLCKAVTDKAIKQHVANGVRSMRELRACSGLGSQCGQCTCQASQILHNETLLHSQQDFDLAHEVA